MLIKRKEENERELDGDDDIDDDRVEKNHSLCLVVFSNITDNEKNDDL